MSNSTQTSGHSATRNTSWPAEATDLLTRVDGFLRADHPREALALLPATGNLWVQNARGVCLLRLGRTSEAIKTLRDLVYGPGGLVARPDVDPVFQANYATALLLDGNAEGFWGILGDIRDRSHPAVAELDEAVRQWKAGMTFWQRAASGLGIGGPRFTLTIPPGHL